MDDIKAKQQVVEKIKASSRILVTVSNNPSVDSLSAALGLTLLLDKQEKYASAIFSGEVPPAILFLEPTKTFDATTDSLRDFIIALNKEKADHLRTKVEGDVVKVYITPYKSTITEEDLEFSQGDYNVDLVIALGVDKQEHLDGALENHGQILHDATVITVTAGDITSTLGGIDWHDAQASSISEMIAGLGEALKTDKTKSLVDAPIATALLTGIVAETERFSNKHTTSGVMTVAAQLMAAGADQQLIATELNNAGEKDASAPVEEVAAKPAVSEPTKKDGLSISHDDDLPTKPVESEEVVEAPAAEEPANAYGVVEESVPELSEVASAIAEPTPEVTPLVPESDSSEEPILSHSYLGGDEAVDPTATPGSQGVNETPPATDEPMHSAYSFDENPEPIATAEPATDDASTSERVIQPLEEPSVELSGAYAADPIAQPLPTPVDLGLPLPPPLPDFSQAPTAPAVPEVPAQQPGILGDILAPEATAPAYEAPQPLPTLPSIESAPVLAPPSVAPAPPAAPSDPGQFKIPGQP